MLATSESKYFRLQICKEEFSMNKFVKFLAVIGAITIVGGIIFAVYKFMKPDYLDEYDDDDYDDDDFDEEDFEVEAEDFTVES